MLRPVSVKDGEIGLGSLTDPLGKDGYYWGVFRSSEVVEMGRYAEDHLDDSSSHDLICQWD